MKPPLLETLSACCSSRLPATLAFLRQMVEINSFTENVAGIERLGELIATAFAPLGFAATRIPAANPKHGSHLVLSRPPIPGAPTIALISHLDTVFTEDEERRNDFAWRQDGFRIYGPGTNDIKGGTALAHLTLSALQAAAPAVFDRVNWSVLLNACEEATSVDFGALCRARLPADTLACVLFEADGARGDGFTLVTSRKGRATFRVAVSGHGAHAGAQHQRGANAVVQLARAVSEIHKLTDYEAGVTVNVGSIQGGTVTNRVPHFASAELEMRAFDPVVFERAKKSVLAWNGEGELAAASDSRLRCRIETALVDEAGPWPANAGSERLFSCWQAAGRELGFEVRQEARGGLSDGNVLWDAFPSIDGAGPRGANSHCSEQNAEAGKEQEWADAGSFAPKAVLNCAALLKLCEAETENA